MPWQWVPHCQAGSREDPTTIRATLVAASTAPVQNCQNMAGRLVLQQSCTSSVHYLMDQLHWLPIHAQIDFKIATLTLSAGQLAYLCELIFPYQPSRSQWSSNQLLLTVPHANLTNGQHIFCYSSPVIWNAIPLSVRDAPSISTFKSRVA